MDKNNYFFDVYHQEDNTHIFSYRSKLMVYEESFTDGALVSSGYNAAGYPLNVLRNFPSRLNRKKFAEPFAFNLEIDGQCLDFGLEFVNYKEDKTERSLHSTLTLKSTIKPVLIKVHTLLDGTQMYSRWLEVENLSDSPLKLSRLSVLSGGIESLDDDLLENAKSIDEIYSLGYFSNDAWGNEGQFKWEKLEPGRKAIEARFGRDRFRHPLLFIKNNLNGQIWFTQIGYSGGYKFLVALHARENKSFAHLSFKAEITGHNPIYVIGKNETFTSPVVHMGVVQGDLDDAVNEMHHHIRRSVLNTPEADGSEALINCGMGAEHHMSVEETKAFIDQFALMGGEVFTIDAGWVCPPGKQTEWGTFNGLNVPNKERYPNGLKELCDYAHEKGLKFGLWVDIESIGEACPLNEQHPEWRSVNVFGERTGKFLDMSIPEVAEWAENELARIIDEYELDLLRVDHNVDFTEYFGMRDTSYGILECVCLKHNEAVYKMYERLKNRFPKVIFENCAGGGGRTDLGMMKSFNHTWVSDWQKMPRSIAITNGMTMALPPERVDRLFAGMGCHTVGAFDAHLRNTMLGHISLNVVAPEGAVLNPVQIDFIKHSTDIYKSFIRPILSTCKTYHHTPDLTDKEYSILEISAQDSTRGAITVIGLCNKQKGAITVVPKGIDVSARYKITLDNSGYCYEATGAQLVNDGITVNINALSSELVLYEKS